VPTIVPKLKGWARRKARAFAHPAQLRKGRAISAATTSDLVGLTGILSSNTLWATRLAAPPVLFAPAQKPPRLFEKIRLSEIDDSA
jgi:hypothetical protein